MVLLIIPFTELFLLLLSLDDIKRQNFDTEALTNQSDSDANTNQSSSMRRMPSLRPLLRQWRVNEEEKLTDAATDKDSDTQTDNNLKKSIDAIISREKRQREVCKESTLFSQF